MRVTAIIKVVKNAIDLVYRASGSGRSNSCTVQRLTSYELTRDESPVQYLILRSVNALHRKSVPEAITIPATVVSIFLEAKSSCKLNRAKEPSACSS